MQLLSTLLKDIQVIRIQGPDCLEVSDITADSRAVNEGSIFVAVCGTAVDGHRYIPSALEHGAAVVVCQHIPADAADTVTWVKVPDTSVALGQLASAWYGHPSRLLSVVGVTGTNGKTTIATLLYRAMMSRDIKAGLLSTVTNRVADTEYPADHTTPDPLEINRLMALMVEAGCQYCFMEVSSHGMAQNRVAGLYFKGGIFINLTRDHLDYHKTFKAYLEAKKRFFDLLPEDAWAIINIDDPNGKVMVQNTRARVLTYSLRTLADFHCRPVEIALSGMTLNINDVELVTRLTGRFNAYNLTAVYGALVSLGMKPEDAACSVSSLPAVCGRFETVTAPDGLSVIIDYAHTPDALANVLDTILAVRPDTHITTVAGAGGNRDHGKRPVMAAEAARRSARLFITSDNPRDENPEDIANDMIAGVPENTDCQIIVNLDRAAAIAAAIATAPPDGVVLVAGKGHETYQIFAGGRVDHFDDHEQVALALKQRAEL